MKLPDLTEAAQTALINANTRTGALPQGTPAAVNEELRHAGLVAALGMTMRGRAVREALIEEALEF